MTPQPATGTKVPSVMHKDPSIPPELSIKAVDQHMIPLQTTNPTPPCQDRDQSQIFPCGMLQTMYIATTMSTKDITEAVALQEIKFLLWIILKQHSHVQDQQSNLSPLITQALNGKYSRTSPHTAEIQLYTPLPETPSQPSETIMEALINRQCHVTQQIQHYQVSCRWASNIAQCHGTTNGYGPYPRYRISLALQDIAAAPQKNSQVTHAHPDNFQALYPNLTSIRVKILDVEHCITPPPATGTKFPSVMHQNTSRVPDLFMKAVY